MKIRCIETAFANLAKRTQSIYGYAPPSGLSTEYLDSLFEPISVGFWEGSLWYYVVVDDELLPLPAALCVVVDGDLPKTWVATSSGVGEDFAWYLCPSAFLTPTFEVFYASLMDNQGHARQLLELVLAQQRELRSS